MIRQIVYSITADTKGIEPKTRQWAGMQYEDNATEVIFDISALGIENALYRIDFNSAGAGYQPSENLTAEGGKLGRLIPKSVTQYGGEVQVTAVITELDGEGDETGVVLTYPVTVYFTPVEKSRRGNDSVEGNISRMEQLVKDMTEKAVNAASEAEDSSSAALEAQALTEEARRALEGGTQFIFWGGDAESSAEVGLVVDDGLSDVSTNPVQNKAVTAKLNALEAGAETDRQAIDGLSQDIAALIPEIDAAPLAAHPVGSLYWGADPTDPSELFGGTWELIDKEFAPTELYNVGLTVNTDTASSGSVFAKLAGHTVEITAELVNAIEIGDANNVHWGDLAPGAFGCSEFSQSLNTLSVNDGANGCVMFTVSNAGAITSGDTIGSRPIPAAETTNGFTVIFTQMPHLMLDDYCNKFCWKRTA